MAWFEVPEGYSCVIRQSDTTLYGYTGSRRDTFVLNGLSWEKTSTQTSSTIPANPVCISNPQIPSSIIPALVVAGTLLVLGAFNLIAKMIRRTYL